MFQVIEKGGERKAVYSKGDLDYMIGRGWRPVSVDPTPAPPPDPRVKRKYTRRAKA